MKLHQNIQLFRDAVRITAQQMNIPPEFVEKDYWVTYCLPFLMIKLARTQYLRVELHYLSATI